MITYFILTLAPFIIEGNNLFFFRHIIDGNYYITRKALGIVLKCGQYSKLINEIFTAFGIYTSRPRYPKWGVTKASRFQVVALKHVANQE